MSPYIEISVGYGKRRRTVRVSTSIDGSTTLDEAGIPNSFNTFGSPGLYNENVFSSVSFGTQSSLFPTGSYTAPSRSGDGHEDNDNEDDEDDDNENHNGSGTRNGNGGNGNGNGSSGNGNGNGDGNNGNNGNGNGNGGNSGNRGNGDGNKGNNGNGNGNGNRSDRLSGLKSLLAVVGI